MANQEQVELLLSGVDKWNSWRESHPEVAIDLEAADLLTAKLRQADLRGADLCQADLEGAGLPGAPAAVGTQNSAQIAYLGGNTLSIPIAV